jgi:SnoaL-like domain
MAKLSAKDLIEIEQLNARYAFAFDDLLSDAAAAWAATFAPDGRFTLRDAHDNVQVDEQGTKALKKLHDKFSDRATTRHWYGNLLIEPARGGARMRCYFISLNIATRNIVRTAIYEDQLVKVRRRWRFKLRSIRLDPGSS